MPPEAKELPPEAKELPPDSDCDPIEYQNSALKNENDTLRMALERKRAYKKRKDETRNLKTEREALMEENEHEVKTLNDENDSLRGQNDDLRLAVERRRLAMKRRHARRGNSEERHDFKVPPQALRPKSKKAKEPSVGGLPQVIHVRSPSGQCHCSGYYELSAGESGNGQAVWKMAGGKRWIYSNPAGEWLVGGELAKTKGFQCSAGFLWCSTAHGGTMPDAVAGTWKWLDGNGTTWHDDNKIKVFTDVPPDPPAVLHVTSPNGQHHCTGSYDLVAGEKANGNPIWKMSGGLRWIYCGQAGKWVIGDEQEKAKAFQCSAGYVATCGPHASITPDRVQMGFKWLDADGRTWHEDADIFVSVKAPGSLPSVLHVSTPNGQAHCTGAYDLTDEKVNGHALWQLRGGKRWIYSSSAGEWLIGGDKERTSGFQGSAGFLWCTVPHVGIRPDQVKSPWKRWDGKLKSWHEDPAVAVTYEDARRGDDESDSQ